VQTFWVADQAKNNYFSVRAALAYKTTHTYFYLQDGVNIGQEALKTAADYFETTTYPTEHQLFGSESAPASPAQANSGRRRQDMGPSG